MKKIKFLLMFFLFGCQTQNIPNEIKEKEQTVKDTLKIDTLSKLDVTVDEAMKKDTKQVTFSCMNTLIKLIKKSNYKAEYKRLDFNLYIDNIEDSVVTLGLTIKNEERNDDVALSWMELDLKKKILRDVTIDPDRPIILKTDTIILKQILNNCKFQNVIDR